MLKWGYLSLRYTCLAWGSFPSLLSDETIIDMCRTGPFIFAPLSELYGRQPAYLVSQVLMVFFCLGTALAPKSVTLVSLRFSG
jgi:MFS family permease